MGNRAGSVKKEEKSEPIAMNPTAGKSVWHSDFEGKVAIVNGGTRGLGEAIAKLLAKNGAKVVITGRTKHQGEAVAASINSDGGEALYHQMDCTKEAEIVQLHEVVIAKLGGFDFAINNLGVEDSPPVELKDSTEESFDRCITTKAKSAFLGMKHQINHFLNNKKPGAIVNVSSMIGLGGHANVPAYSAANGAVQALTKSAAIEVAKDGIRINCICPSGMKGTPMLHRFTGGSDGSKETDGQCKAGEGYESYLQHFTPKYPMQRIGDAEEVARAALFLLSQASSWITGHNLPVDGGFTVSLM